MNPEGHHREGHTSLSAKNDNIEAETYLQKMNQIKK